MPQYNDCMNEALAAQVTRLGAIQDMLYEYLLLNGGTGGGINDLWNQVWDLAGITSGAFNDRAFEWLGILGYTDPDLQTRWLTFWCAGGLISTETNFVLNSRLCDNTGDGVPENWAVTEDKADLVYAKKSAAETQWAAFMESGGKAYIEQIINLQAGEYVASLTINEIWTPSSDYYLAFILGGGAVVNTDFPKSLAVSAPAIITAQFTMPAVGDITFYPGVLAAVPDIERCIFSKPQIISGTEYKPAETTGVECTGEARELFYNSNHEPVKDANGDYAYVIS